MNGRDEAIVLPEELREKTDLNINFSPTEHGKALGLRWNTLKDTLSVSVPPLQPPSLATKRVVCSAIAKTFDVTGWYAPAVLPAKLLLQFVETRALLGLRTPWLPTTEMEKVGRRSSSHQ